MLPDKSENELCRTLSPIIFRISIPYGACDALCTHSTLYFLLSTFNFCCTCRCSLPHLAYVYYTILFLICQPLSLLLGAIAG